MTGESLKIFPFCRLSAERVKGADEDGKYKTRGSVERA